MASIFDQYEMARIPIKPLPYSERSNAQCNEFMIDYGSNGSYHMYIVHHSDQSTYIDLTNLIINEIFPSSHMDADNYTVTIEGIEDPQTLQDIINEIYKNYLYPDRSSGFDVSTDLSKMLNDAAVSILLTDNSGVIYLPVTTADNVFDSNGVSIQQRLDEMTRMAFSIDYLYATSDNQTVFEFQYPFENYSDFMEVRIGTTYVDRTRYNIIEKKSSDGNIYGGTIVFLDESIEIDRRVDILFIYNSAIVSGTYSYVSGSNVARASLPTNRLEKVSDSYTLNDSSSVATSAAVYNLNTAVTDMFSDDDDNVFWLFDSSTSSSTIKVTVNQAISTLMSSEACLFNIVTKCKKNTSAVISVTGTDTTKSSALYDLDGSSHTTQLGASKLVKFLWDPSTSKFYIVNDGSSGITTTQKIYSCSDQEETISFAGLDYDGNSIIQVYRNGVRMFENYDYSIDTGEETITLYVRTENGETIIFEALSTD